MKVTLLSGFLGAGKTTLLKRILRLNNERDETHRLRMAVIVNDMGEINLDAEEIRNSKVVQEDAEMVEMHNGCICCTLRGDLLKTVKSLSQEGRFDYLVIESTGIGEPLPVAQTFTMDVDQLDDDDEGENEAEAGEGGDKEDEDGESNIKKRKLEVATDAKASLSHYATLDTLVTVVDGLNLYDVLDSIETLADENNISGMLGNTGASTSNADDVNMDPDDEDGVCALDDEVEGANEIDDRPVSQLWLDQIEFANVIVVSKASLLLKKEGAEKGERKLKEIETLLKKLNSKAKILVPREDKYGDLDVSQSLIDTGLFDMEEASASAGWQEELEKEDHSPETEEYSISSTVFRASDRPFHPDRLSAILGGFGDYTSALNINNDSSDSNDEAFRGVVRSKGQLWLANTNAYPIDFHSAGAHIDISMNEEEMPFLSAIKRSEWEKEEEEIYKSLVRDGKWSEKYGDRRSEIVFIGVCLNKKSIHEKLASALLTDEESVKLGGMAGWRNLSDPFFGGTAQDYFALPPGYGAE